jgi:hypothetical protein
VGFWSAELGSHLKTLVIGFHRHAPPTARVLSSRGPRSARSNHFDSVHMVRKASRVGYPVRVSHESPDWPYRGPALDRSSFVRAPPVGAANSLDPRSFGRDKVVEDVPKLNPVGAGDVFASLAG